MYWSLENVPWTNLHDLNLDWIVNTMKQTVEQWIAYRLEMDGKYADFTKQINSDFDDFTEQINSDFTNFTTGINEWKTLIETEFSDLQTYVQNYFDNLDLNESTRYVINQMIASGEFIRVLNPSIVSATEAWLASHITPTTPAVDDTLTVSGAAADAKVTGDKFLQTIPLYGYSNSIIPDNTDIDSITTYGTYRVTSTSHATTMTNLPTPRPGQLVVSALTAATSNIQFYTTTAGLFFVRFWDTNNTWSDWKEFTKGINEDTLNNTINNITTNITNLNRDTIKYERNLQNGEDLNTLLSNGRYTIPAAVGKSLINKPSEWTKGTGTLFCFYGAAGGTNITAQLLFCQPYEEWWGYLRLMNNTTGQPVDGYDWRQILGEIRQEPGTGIYATMSQNAITNALYRWNNKTIVTFGDSRTWYDGKTYISSTKEEWRGRTCVGYQEQIRKLCGATVINEGVSGETSVEICNRIRQYNFRNIDAVFIEGGVNDFIRTSTAPPDGSLQPIGSNFDTTTAYGAWQSAIEYIMTNYPSVKIYIDVPAIAWKDTPSTVYPYAKAEIKNEVADLYNIPCLNLYKDGGITTLNRAYFYADDTTLTNGYYLHFNDNGNAWLGAIIAEFINTH